MKAVGGRRVWALTEITAALAKRLDEIPSVWVEAEVHSLRRRNNQVYFTLLDGHQIDASMNAIVFDRLAMPPRDGTLVHAYGRIEFWAERTQIRMRIERMEPAGIGLLLARIEELTARLRAEGLTAPDRRRPLPMLPRRIGLVTSAKGAARDDFLRNLWARFPAADVVLVDVPVQGDAAPGAIVAALRTLDAMHEVDVVVVTRGGGPLEDLMAFNAEEVCRAVAASRAPVVSAVGHEKDVTVCDLVADLRVSTPTAAAEAVVPDAARLAAHLEGAELAMIRGLVRARGRAEERCERRATRLVSALRGVSAQADARVARAEGRLRPALRRVPAPRAVHLTAAESALTRAMDARLRHATGRVDTAAALLSALSPRRTLSRGYAIVRSDAGRPLVAADSVAPGMRVHIELADATVAADVREVIR